MEKYLDLEELHLFVRVVEAGAFAPAARALKIPKTTLSRKFQSLEARLGAQLLVRTTRAVRATEMGRAFLRQALQLLSAEEEARSVVRRAKSEPQGRLRVSAGVEYGMAVVGPLVEEFLARHAKLEVELDLSGRRVDMVREGFDLAVRIGPLPDSSLACRRIGFLRYGVYASPRYLAGLVPSRVPRAPDDLAHHPALAFTRGRHPEAWRLVSGERERSVELRVRLAANNFWVLRGACERGLGLAYMPTLLAADAEARGSLVRVLPEWGSEAIPVHVVYPAQTYVAPNVRAFVDFLCERAGGEAPITAVRAGP